MLIEGINPSIRIHGLNDILLFQAYRLWMEYPSRDLDEKTLPIRSWRIGERRDRPCETELIFRAPRGMGYSKDGYEEVVRFWIKQSGSGWSLSSYGAIY